MSRMGSIGVTFIVCALTAVFFDVYIVMGWAASLGYFIVGAYWLLGPNGHIAAVRIKAITSFAVLALTTLLGYSQSYYVKQDVFQFAAGASSVPKDKREFKTKTGQQLNWLTRSSILSYSNVDGNAMARLRMFPYTIADFDFQRQQFTLRAYD